MIPVNPQTPEQIFDNEVCTKVYEWCKLQTPGQHEPYSPFVADVATFVLDILKLERARVASQSQP